MHLNPRIIAYGLAAFVLLNALFIMQSNQISDNNYVIAEFKQTIRQEFLRAFMQTAGDTPWLGSAEIVIGGIIEFYDQAADELIALLNPRGTDDDLVRVAQAVYSSFKTSEYPEGEYTMTEEPLYNITPAVPVVAGIQTQNPVNGPNQWVTLRDNYTGQLYCLAMYNGEMNKYLGACKKDD